MTRLRGGHGGDRALREHRRPISSQSNAPSKLARISTRRVAWLILYCARRTRPFVGRAFREHRRTTRPPIPHPLYFFFGKG